jgi:hypothetical protein
LLIASASNAAPINFELNATVAAGTSVPFDITPGTKFVGTFSFDPASPGPAYPEIYELRFVISGTTLIAPQFQILVDNDLQRRIDIAGRIADPTNTPDSDFNGIGDNILISCIPNQPFCGTVAGYGDFEFQPQIVFFDQTNHFNSTALPADVATWNDFEFREMSILFKDVVSGRTQYVGAYISYLSAVPEASALVYLAVVLASSTAIRRATRGVKQ